MSRFLTTFQGELIRDPVWPWQRPIWRLHATLEFQSDIPEIRSVISDGKIVVKEGFETDLASVPRIPCLWWLAGGTANEPGAVHDWLCFHRESLGISRATADAVLREACEVIGMPWAGRAVLYYGARIGALLGIGG